MKILKRLVLGLLAVVLLLILGLYASGHGYILRGVRVTYFNGHSTAFLDDYKYFNIQIKPAAALAGFQKIQQRQSHATA